MYNELRRKVEVCDNCGCASCWHGEFMCDAASTAVTTIKTVGELDKLSIENKDHYSKVRIFQIYGVAAPHGYA